MSEFPVQRSEAAPESVVDPVEAAQSVVADPAKVNSPEWLAAKQLLADHQKAGASSSGFAELEREMQALRGMSQI